MKLIFTLTILLSLQLSFAQEQTKINRGDVSISGTTAQITSVKPICPKVEGGMSCMAYGSIVKIRVNLAGCLDTFGGHFSSFKVEKNKGVLAFGAINIANKASLTALCYTIPTKIISITVPFEGDIKLENMDFRGNITPEY